MQKPRISLLLLKYSVVKMLSCIIPSNLNGVLESSPPQMSFPCVMDDCLRLNNLQNAYLIQRLTLCISYVQLLSRVWLFATPWTAAHQASLSITNSWSLLKLMSIESVMPSNHLILCHPLLLPPSIFPSIKVFSNESVLCIRWPMYWSFSFSIILSMNIQDLFPLG